MALDVTARKQAEAALKDSEAQLRRQAQALEQTLLELQHTQTQLVQSEKMSSLGQLVAGIAHEINNPVNFIYGNVNHASDYIQAVMDLLDTYQREYPNPTLALQDEIEEIDLDFLREDLPKLLGSLKVGADRIRGIVSSLRTFSRLDEAEVKSVNIHEGIDSTLMILQNRLKAKPGQPEIRVVKEYGSIPLIECHAGQLNQVFMNILANAIDALEEWMDTGQIEPRSPTICIRTEATAGDRVGIHISDNGPGMPELTRQRLFDPFFTTKPTGKGTGLGLSISHQIVVEKHQGTLECHSSPGQGTEFIIALPI